MPSPTCLSIEQHERLFIVNYPGGSRLNRTIGMIVSAMLSAKSGYKVGYQFDPYRVIIDAPARTTVKDMLAIMKGFASDIGSLLRFAIKDSPALKSQLLHSARKMGAIAPDADVGKFGMRKLALMALSAFCGIALLYVLLFWNQPNPSVAVLVAFLSVQFFCLGFLHPLKGNPGPFGHNRHDIILIDFDRFFLAA